MESKHFPQSINPEGEGRLWGEMAQHTQAKLGSERNNEEGDTFSTETHSRLYYTFLALQVTNKVSLTTSKPVFKLIADFIFK